MTKACGKRLKRVWIVDGTGRFTNDVENPTHVIDTNWLCVFRMIGGWKFVLRGNKVVLNWHMSATLDAMN